MLREREGVLLAACQLDNFARQLHEPRRRRQRADPDVLHAELPGRVVSAGPDGAPVREEEGVGAARERAGSPPCRRSERAKVPQQCAAARMTRPGPSSLPHSGGKGRVPPCSGVHDAVPSQRVHRLWCRAERPGPLPQLPLAPVAERQRKGLGRPHPTRRCASAAECTAPARPVPTPLRCAHAVARQESAGAGAYKQAKPAAGLVARRREANSVPFTRRFSACAASRSKDRAAGAAPDSSMASSAAAAPRTTRNPCLRASGPVGGGGSKSPRRHPHPRAGQTHLLTTLARVLSLKRVCRPLGRARSASRAASLPGPHRPHSRTGA